MKYFVAVAGAAAMTFTANGSFAEGHEDCFDKGGLEYVDCPTEPEPVIEEEVVEIVPALTWTGFYIGAHAGYAWTDVDGLYDGGFFDVPGLDLDGAVAGGQIGYLHQYDNNIVVGAEIDASAVFADDRDEDGDNSFDAELDYLASARLRLGYALEGGFLPYITGGVALAGYSVDIDDGDTPSFDETAVGGVAGGGVEYMFDENWSLRAEGLYYFFDDELDLEGSTDFADEGDFFSIEEVFVGRIGVNFRF